MIFFLAVSSPLIVHSSDVSRIPGFSHDACMPRSLWAKRLEVVCGKRGRTLFKQPWNSRRRRGRKRGQAREEVLELSKRWSWAEVGVMGDYLSTHGFTYTSCPPSQSFIDTVMSERDGAALCCLSCDLQLLQISDVHTII